MTGGIALREESPMAFTMSSPAFGSGEAIPEKHSRAGGNVSPALEWRDTPPETKSFVLIVEDPDAPRGTFRHWAIYNIPAKTDELPEGAGSASNESLKHGVNDFGNAQYDGPQPPPGHGTHHYHFWLGALDVLDLDLPRQPSAVQIWEAAQAHLVAEARFVGTFAG
jgi:Raf kinase inhibitor-like YbhB/YbcL family protein